MTKAEFNSIVIESLHDKLNIPNSFIEFMDTVYEEYLNDRFSNFDKLIKLLKRPLVLSTPYDDAKIVALKIMGSMAGRLWEEFSKRYGSTNGNKFEKNASIPYNGEEVMIDSLTYVATIMQLYGRLHPLEPKINWLNAGLDMVSESGTINPYKVIPTFKKALLKDKGDKVKGWEEVAEVAGLIRGFNNPEEYGYYMVSAIDGKAQNWTIYGLLLLNDADFCKLVNISSDNGWLVPTNDRNSQALDSLKHHLVSLNYASDVSELDWITRDVPKFITMLLSFGSGMKTAIDKAVDETDDIIGTFLSDKHEVVIDWISKFIPNIRKFQYIFTQLQKQGGFEYSYSIGGLKYFAANIEKKPQEIEIPDLINPSIKRRIIRSEVSLSKTQKMTFKYAYSTHNADSWIAQFTKNSVYKMRHVHVSTNHDSFVQHIKYVWDVVDANTVGYKILHSEDYFTNLMYTWYGSKDMEHAKEVIKYLRSDTTPMSLDNLTTSNFINALWAF